MIKPGTILIVDDDADDTELLYKIIRDLGVQNKIECLDSTEKAYTYIAETSEKIFIIFSDINMPGQTGLKFKAEIEKDERTRVKGIPFIFYSTWTHDSDVMEAYSQALSVQGYFKKGTDIKAMKKQVKMILKYWNQSVHPNSSRDQQYSY